MNNIPKPQYFVSYTNGIGATYSVPVSMDSEINDAQGYASLFQTVARHAVTNGQARSMEEVTITNVSLLNPGRDVEFVGNEMLEQSFVELFEIARANGLELSEELNNMYASVVPADKGVSIDG